MLNTWTHFSSGFNVLRVLPRLCSHYEYAKTNMKTENVQCSRMGNSTEANATHVVTITQLTILTDVKCCYDTIKSFIFDIRILIFLTVFSLFKYLLNHSDESLPLQDCIYPFLFCGRKWMLTIDLYYLFLVVTYYKESQKRFFFLNAIERKMRKCPQKKYQYIYNSVNWTSTQLFPIRPLYKVVIYLTVVLIIPK